MIDKNTLLDLEKGGFIVKDTIDELDLIRHSMLSSRYNSQHFTLTIAPTLNCNFDCTYCYEKNSRMNSYMSSEVQDKIIELIKKRIPTIASLSITWYGGEPLIALDVIESMSKKVIELCQQSNVNYSSRIVTNGYNLNKNVAEKLIECKIDGIQITLDGPKDIHDKRRPLIGGQGTFDVIMKNLIECIDTIKNISIRINTDKENESRIDEVLDIFDKYNLSDKIHPYLGFVEPTNDCYFKNSCLSKKSFSQIHYNFIKKLEQKGFIKNLTVKYPLLVGNFCGADYVGSLVIDPNGNMYKCWSDIGMDKHCVGNLINKDTDTYSLETYINYMIYDPTNDNKCKQCIYLPICMGGCPRARKDIEEERCTEYKYALDMYIKEISATLYSNIENK